jgi:hypothetical protein
MGIPPKKGKIKNRPNPLPFKKGFTPKKKEGLLKGVLEA